MSYVLFNDQITKREHVNIDMEDRGYNFGDGIYEVIPIYEGNTFAMEEHIQRFLESASKLEIKLPYDKTVLEQQLNELKIKNKVINGIIYIQMTRGVSSRAHLYERNVEGLITGFCREMTFQAEQKLAGVSVFLTEDIRWLRCDIKSINLLGNIMAKRQAADNDCQEAIMHRNGILTEGSSSNLFIVKGKQLQTHPPTNLILNGITRQIVVKLAKEKGFTINEEAFSLKQLVEADEAFITSTTQEITPITKIIGDTSATFSVGTITKELQNAFMAYIDKEKK
jgi:D-alanine transaminase